ncbi:probable low affinity copper uptake protein 2 isoform X2 [Mercenaria mercenaria]|uniref:probable low affinity copper uptake protein 2 isoform X2 n=1 Tax=Mercenaria mercenaria TaxID=6596 RepID=UPI00234F654F|nr:probable low affinity copper uptake protein 2 isoform X2 [Mercenaria mercenaria]
MAYRFGASHLTIGDGYMMPTLEMMKNMSMHMGEYFYFSTTVKNFMFEDLSFHGSAGVVCVCLIIFSFTVLLEGTKSLIFYLRLRQNQNPLTYGKTETSIQTERLKFHIGGYLLHSVDLLLGYLLMLAVMSYDAYILIAVILGSGVGYFVFGAINTRNQIKFQALQMSVYDRYDSQAGLTNSDASTNDASTNGSRYGSNGNTCDKTAR